MKPKTTIVLVVLLAVVIAGYLIITRSAPPAGPGTTTTADRLIDLDPAAVDTIRVERGDRQYTLGRIDGAWTQTEPTRFGVESFRVEDLLNAAADMEVVESFTPGSGDRPALAELELEPPTATVVFDDTTLHLGRLTIGGRAYATVAGSGTVAVVPDRLHRFVADTSVNDLRTRTLDGAAASGLERLDVAWQAPSVGGVSPDETEATRFSLIKQDGEWYLGEPTANRADRATIADYARRLAGLRIDGFIDDDGDLATFGLDQPHETYVAYQSARKVPGDDPSEAPPVLGTLRVGNPADFAGDLRFATWSIGDTPSTLVFTLNDTDLDDLRQSPDHFRDPSLLATDAAAITSVTLQGPAVTPITVLRDGAAFAFAPTDGTPPPAYAVDSQVAFDWFNSLAGLTADTFAPLPPDDATPDATIAIVTTTDLSPTAIQLYRQAIEATDDAQAPPAVWLAVVADESAARVLSDDRVSSLTITPLALRNLDVFDLRPADIQRVTLTGPGWAELTLRREDGVWFGEDGVTLDAAAADRLVASLATLRAAEWIEPTHDQWRSRNAQAAVDIATESGEPVTRVLSFNPESGLALLDGQADEAFALMRLPASVVDRLSAELRDTALLDFPVNRIARVTLTRDGDTLTIDRPAIGPVVASGDLADDTDDAQATRLLETLAGLEAERFAPAPAPETVTDALAEWQIVLDDGTTRRLAAYRDPDDPSRTLWCTAGPDGTRWFTLRVADANALGLPVDDGDAAADDMK
ncbi:MAG: DUF4340 domain-containing protein [Planctomycetota bacterium]